jgi:hypothetical protein
MTRITPIEIRRAATPPTGRNAEKYPENATASVAIDPLAMTKKLVHP